MAKSKKKQNKKHYSEPVELKKMRAFYQKGATEAQLRNYGFQLLLSAWQVTKYVNKITGKKSYRPIATFVRGGAPS